MIQSPSEILKESLVGSKMIILPPEYPQSIFWVKNGDVIVALENLQFRKKHLNVKNLFFVFRMYQYFKCNVAIDVSGHKLGMREGLHRRLWASIVVHNGSKTPHDKILVDLLSEELRIKNFLLEFSFNKNKYCISQNGGQYS